MRVLVRRSGLLAAGLSAAAKAAALLDGGVGSPRSRMRSRAVVATQRTAGPKGRQACNTRHTEVSEVGCFFSKHCHPVHVFRPFFTLQFFTVGFTIASSVSQVVGSYGGTCEYTATKLSDGSSSTGRWKTVKSASAPT